MTRLISVVVWILVVVLAGVSFALSYVPLRNVAVTYGAPVSLAFLWPLLIDGGLIVFYLGLVRASILGESLRWFWVLIGVSTVATCLFNLVHADANPVSIGVALAPPVVLFFSTDTLVRMLKSQAKRLDLSDTIAAMMAKIAKLEQQTAIRQAELDTETGKAQAELDTILTSIETSRQELATLTGQMEEARARIVDAVGDAILIWSDTGPVSPAIATPEMRQALLVEWAKRGQSRDTIREMYPDVFSKTHKTFDRDAANCNGQLVKFWGE